MVFLGVPGAVLRDSMLDVVDIADCRMVTAVAGQGEPEVNRVRASEQVPAEALAFQTTFAAERGISFEEGGLFRTPLPSASAQQESRHSQYSVLVGVGHPPLVSPNRVPSVGE